MEVAAAHEHDDPARPAAAEALRRWRRAGAWRSATVVQCATALAWTIGLALFFGAWYAVERSVLALPPDSRLVRSAIVVPMIALGVPHILIGFLFLATSRRTRAPLARLHLGLLVVASVALCWAYAAALRVAAGAQPPARGRRALLRRAPAARRGVLLRRAPRRAGRARARSHAPLPRGVHVDPGGDVDGARDLPLRPLRARQAPRAAGAAGPRAARRRSARGGAGRWSSAWSPRWSESRWWAWSRAEPGGMIAALRRHAPIAIVYWLFLNVVLAGRAGRRRARGHRALARARVVPVRRAAGGPERGAPGPRPAPRGPRPRGAGSPASRGRGPGS